MQVCKSNKGECSVFVFLYVFIRWVVWWWVYCDVRESFESEETAHSVDPEGIVALFQIYWFVFCLMACVEMADSQCPWSGWPVFVFVRRGTVWSGSLPVGLIARLISCDANGAVVQIFQCYIKCNLQKQKRLNSVPIHAHLRMRWANGDRTTAVIDSNKDPESMGCFGSQDWHSKVLLVELLTSPSTCSYHIRLASWTHRLPPRIEGWTLRDRSSAHQSQKIKHEGWHLLPPKFITPDYEGWPIPM